MSDLIKTKAMETTNKSLSVFLVDDDRMFLLSLKNELKRRFKNITLSTFINGEDCLSHLGEKPDIVILDYYLTAGIPGALNGMEVLKKIKSISNSIQVVMLSAQDKLEVAASAIKYGAIEYVAKSETAFIRLQNVLKNSMDVIEYSRETKQYEAWNYLMALFLLIYTAVTALYYLNH